MIVFPNAKINIGLNIIEKRPDGFHNIESIFYPILDLFDVLEIVENNESDQMEFTSTGIEIPGDRNNNLCIKAYQLLKSEFNIPNVKMHLHKNIPIGAGLGGGSADGAFTLVALNGLFSLGLSEESLMKYARLLGSDCAFFIRNKPVFAFEKGDVFKEISLDLSNYSIQIKYPNEHIGTEEAYQNITLIVPENRIQELIKKPVEEWENLINNDFENSLFSNYPEIKKLKNDMYESGALYSSMTGSGSAVYGIFKKTI
jgi:4-diphosphocytidyl-2-C-methyl-D-erythritol kinase